MMTPVTSTRVATNGAEDVAGSNFNDFMRRGSIDPDIVPHKTTPTKDKPTQMATRCEWGPYMSVNNAQRVILK